MDHKEWIRRALKHEDCGAVPYNFMFTPPAQRHAEAHYGENLQEQFSLPIRMSGPKSIKPLYASPKQFGDTAKDEFGVIWSTSILDRGSPIGPCLPEASLKGYTFPDPTLEYRFEDLGTWCRDQETHYRILWVGDLWERATFMRGMEQLLLDVALNPTFVEELLGCLTNGILKTLESLFARFEFEAVALSDDYGTQQGMLLSPTDWRRLVRPCLSRIYGLAKQHECAVFHHSCGNIQPIIPDMIDLGLDILHPIQPEAMDVLQLKREFGRDLTFCGGLSTQGVLVHGTPNTFRGEVRRLKDKLGNGGGYILEPGITIQDDVPVENMIAAIDEAMQ